MGAVFNQATVFEPLSARLVFDNTLYHIVNAVIQMAVSSLTPDAEWYRRISREHGVTPRCPFGTVERCPRYYASLSLLGETGGTKISADEKTRLAEFWEKSELWPRTGEQAPAVIGGNGKWLSLYEFCPEVTFDAFGFFVKGLGNYYDSTDRAFAYERLEKEGVPGSHWRWQWEWLKPMHFTECPLYSPLTQTNVKVPKPEEKREELITLKPNLWGMSVNLNEGWKRLLKWLEGRKP